jgi:ankyrin repeat protein
MHKSIKLLLVSLAICSAVFLTAFLGRNILLLESSNNGNVFLVRATLVLKAQVDARDKRGWAPLMYAIKRKHLDVAKVLLDHGANVNVQEPKNLFSPMYLAAYAGDIRSISLLSENGANINALDKDGATPLFGAMTWRRYEAVKALLERHADPNAGVLAGEPALFCAIEKDDSAIVAMLLQHQVQVNLLDSIGVTALSRAVFNGNLPIIKLLLAHGVEVNGRNRDGKTPIFFAVMHNDTGLVSYLIREKANVNAQDLRGLTPLMHAANKRNSDVMEILLRNGADPYLESTTGHDVRDLIMGMNDFKLALLLNRYVKSGQGSVKNKQ